jgi:ribosome maturation factor RimP
MHLPSSSEHSVRSPEDVASSAPKGSGDDALARVRDVLEPLAVSHGVSIDGVVWTTERGARTLRVTIERPGAASTGGGFGVTVDDCADFSRDASAALDAIEGVIDGAYHLEVSSPGLDRPLRSATDFRRFRGEIAKVKLKVPAVDGQRVLRGTIVAVTGEVDTDTTVEMLVDGKTHHVAHAAIESAQLSFDLGAQPKPTNKGKRPKGQPARVAASPSPRADAPRAREKGGRAR